MRPVDLLGGPTRSIEPEGVLFRLTVTPPAWSGFTKSASILLTADQRSRYEQWMATGAMIQEALPDLSPQEREVILTGIGPQDWDDAFENEEDED